ncbi:MAG: metallophosphoesterase [Candidatus Poribacteria bacterium]
MKFSLTTAMFFIGLIIVNLTAGITLPLIFKTPTHTATSDTATITWDTDIPCIGAVYYATDADYSKNNLYNLSATEETSATHHVITLTGLKSATKYHYQVVATTDDISIVSSDKTFQTLPAVPAIVRGPYLSKVTSNSITIAYETDIECSSILYYTTADHYNETGLYDKQVKSQSSALGSEGYHHVVNLTGLSPSTEYRYQVVATAADGGTATSDNYFRTAVQADEPFTFVAFGDTRTRPDEFGSVVDMIVSLNPNFVLHTGDLVSDGRNLNYWADFFRAGRKMLQNIPFYPSLGNHERNAKYYYDFFELPGNEQWYAFEYGNSLFVALDSDQSAIGPSEDLNENGVLDGPEDVGIDGLPDEKEPGYDAVTNPDPNKDNYNDGRGPDDIANSDDDKDMTRDEKRAAYTEGNGYWEYPSEPDLDGDFIFDEKAEDLNGNGIIDETPQYRFLKETLASSKATWKFVYFHHPPYSSSSHGSDLRIQKAWQALFEEYDVDIVFNGHDHTYERGLVNGVYYVVTGGGGAPNYYMTNSPWTIYAESVLHCVQVAVDGDKLEFKMIKTDGTIADNFSLSSPINSERSLK